MRMGAEGEADVRACMTAEREEDMRANMTESLRQAVQLLQEQTLTCVAYKDGEVLSSAQRGVKPLLDFIEQGVSLAGFSVADKVVGKAAAYLYVLLEAKEVYAEVLSEQALGVLQRFDTPVTYGTLVPKIRNRDNTGYCPMESAVMAIDSPDEALDAIRGKYAELTKGNNK